LPSLGLSPHRVQAFEPPGQFASPQRPTTTHTDAAWHGSPQRQLQGGCASRAACLVPEHAGGAAQTSSPLAGSPHHKALGLAAELQRSQQRAPGAAGGVLSPNNTASGVRRGLVFR
jgi:hypothetical protein